MTEKEEYTLHTDITGNCFIVSDDCKFGMFDKLEKKQVIRVIGKLNEQDKEIKKLMEMGQEIYEWDIKRSLYILQVMKKFARQYSQDSIEFNLLYELGKELPINPNNLWPKEAFKEDEVGE